MCTHSIDDPLPHAPLHCAATGEMVKGSYKYKYKYKYKYTTKYKYKYKYKYTTKNIFQSDNFLI